MNKLGTRFDSKAKVRFGPVTLYALAGPVLARVSSQKLSLYSVLGRFQVNSSHGEVVTQWTRHTVNSSQWSRHTLALATKWTRHRVNSSQSELVTKLTNKNFIMTRHRRTPFKATPIELIHALLYYPFVA